MKKFILAGAVAAFMIPSASFAQEAETPMKSDSGAMTTEGGAMSSGAMATDSATPGGAMGAGDASATSDTTGSYTIVKRSSSEMHNDSSNTTANRNTDPAAVQKTIDANPGLAEKLQAEGVMTGDIGAISVEPNGQVIVYSKS